jgi:hypothetical protein
VPKTRLHLDADSTSKALHQALLERGHDVTRTPNEWIASDDSDEQQLLQETIHGHYIFSFNIRDFKPLSSQYREHAGIILAAQSR